MEICLLFILFGVLIALVLYSVLWHKPSSHRHHPHGLNVSYSVGDHSSQGWEFSWDASSTPDVTYSATVAPSNNPGDYYYQQSGITGTSILVPESISGVGLAPDTSYVFSVVAVVTGGVYSTVASIDYTTPSAITTAYSPATLTYDSGSNTLTYTVEALWPLDNGNFIVSGQPELAAYIDNVTIGSTPQDQISTELTLNTYGSSNTIVLTAVSTCPLVDPVGQQVTASSSIFNPVMFNGSQPGFVQSASVTPEPQAPNPPTNPVVGYAINS